MHIKHTPAPGTGLIPVKYRFRKPARLRIRRKDGRVVMEGFGIGETIAVMEPRVRLLVASYERLKEIPMPGGQAIVEYPDDLDVEQVYE